MRALGAPLCVVCAHAPMHVCECTHIYATVNPECSGIPPPFSTQTEPKSSSRRSVTVMARMSLLICSKQIQPWLAVAFGLCVLSFLAACVSGAAATGATEDPEADGFSSNVSDLNSAAPQAESHISLNNAN